MPIDDGDDEEFPSFRNVVASVMKCMRDDSAFINSDDEDKKKIKSRTPSKLRKTAVAKSEMKTKPPKASPKKFKIASTTNLPNPL